MQGFRRINKIALLAGALAAMAAAAPAPPSWRRRPTLADVIKGSKPADWRPLDPANTMYMELPAGRVVIEMAPAFAPNHVDNIRTLVREHYFDGLAVIRSQDNWVVQWGDPDEKNPRPMKSAKATLKGEFTVPLKNDSQLHPPAGPRRLRAAGRPLERLPVGARPESRARLAGPLLRHGRRRPRHRRRQRQRLLAVRGDRPRAAPPRPQHHRGRARHRRHAAAVDDAARRRPDGVLRQARAERADRRGQDGGRRAGSGAQQVRSHAHRQRRPTRPRSKRSATAAARGPRSPPATSTCATPRSRCANRNSPKPGQTPVSAGV